MMMSEFVAVVVARAVVDGDAVAVVALNRNSLKTTITQWQCHFYSKRGESN